MYIPLFLLGLALVVLSSDAFVDAAARLARRLRISDMIIGATIVSLGTTLPELTVSATASAKGLADMAAGNLIGSVICNTALIAGLSQSIRPAASLSPDFKANYLFFFLSAAIFGFFAVSELGFSRFSGLCLLVLLACYLYWSWQRAKKTSPSGKQPLPLKKGSVFSDLLITVLAVMALAFGAKLLVENGSRLALAIGIPEHVISISMIALGTSLPELITSITALVKGHAALSLGNVIGANILNLLMVCGVSSVIRPLTLAPSLLRIDLPVMFTVSLLLALPGILKKRLYRWQGFALLAVYAGYMAYLYFL